MLEGEKLLTEHTCCLCLSDEESTFSSNTVMKSLPLHEMVNYCIGIQVSTIIIISVIKDRRLRFHPNFFLFFFLFFFDFPADGRPFAL